MCFYDTSASNSQCDDLDLLLNADNGILKNEIQNVQTSSSLNASLNNFVSLRSISAQTETRSLNEDNFKTDWLSDTNGISLTPLLEEKNLFNYQSLDSISPTINKEMMMEIKPPDEVIDLTSVETPTSDPLSYLDLLQSTNLSEDKKCKSSPNIMSNVNNLVSPTDELRELLSKQTNRDISDELQKTVSNNILLAQPIGGGPIRIGGKPGAVKSSTAVHPYRCVAKTGKDGHFQSMAINNEDIKFGKSGDKLSLTLEEKTFLEEKGIPVPQWHPVTKKQESALREFRRRLRNRDSAFQSRVRREEYISDLENKLDVSNQEIRKLRNANEALSSVLTKFLHRSPSKRPDTLDLGECSSNRKNIDPK